MSSILITGATGLIGKKIVNSLEQRGENVIIATQNFSSAKNLFPNLKNIVPLNEIDSLSNERIDGIINLAGTNLGARRWNKNFKKEIYDSRIKTTRNIVSLIQQMKNKPEVLINASGVDLYGDTGNNEVDENSPASDTFIAQLVKDWEQEAMRAQQLNVRVVLIRTGFVISRESSALAKMVLPFKLFFGGYAGNGRKYFSWIDIEDVCNVYMFVLDNKNISGAVNAASPIPVTMKEFSKRLGKVLHRPSIIHVPGFILKILYGESTSMILTGRKAIPKKLLESGFKFRYVDVTDSLEKELGSM